MIYLLIYLAIGVFIVLFIRIGFDDIIDTALENEEHYEKVKPIMWLIMVFIWPVLIAMIIFQGDE